MQSGALPVGYPMLSLGSMDPFNTTSFALSILLVFRTQASYDRWVEAREIWGGIVVNTRDIVRQVNYSNPFLLLVRPCPQLASPLMHFWRSSGRLFAMQTCRKVSEISQGRFAGSKSGQVRTGEHHPKIPLLDSASVFWEDVGCKAVLCSVPPGCCPRRSG